MFKHKLPYVRYNRSIEFNKSLILYFKNREHKIEGGIIYFNMTKHDWHFLSDWGLDLVVEDNI